MINYAECRDFICAEYDHPAALKYYCFTDVNIPYYTKIKRSELLRQMYGNIEKVIFPEGGKKEINVFIPCYEYQQWDYNFQWQYPWFQNMAVKNQKDIIFSGLNTVNYAWENVKGYDFIVFMISKEKKHLLKESYLPFEVLLERFYKTKNIMFPDQKENVDMKKLESSWNNLTEYFNTRIVAYENSDYVVYVYKRSTTNVKLHSGKQAF
ncbi:MAG: hypothetical protein ABII23_07280 [bacterium]